MKGILNPKFNEMAFMPDEVAAGLVGEFVQFLLKQDIKCAKLQEKQGKEPDKYTEFHIINDGDEVIVQWCEVFIDFDDPWFEYVGEGETIAKVLALPNNTVELCWDKEEADSRLKAWLEAHPNYKQDEFGRWYNEDEYKSLGE